jgi:hypothetical protein
MIIIDLHVSIQFKFAWENNIPFGEKHWSYLILFRGSRSQGMWTSQIEYSKSFLIPFRKLFDMNTLEMIYCDRLSLDLQKATWWSAIYVFKISSSKRSVCFLPRCHCENTKMRDFPIITCFVLLFEMSYQQVSFPFPLRDIPAWASAWALENLKTWKLENLKTFQATFENETMRLLRGHWPFHCRISIRGCWPVSTDMKFKRPWSPPDWPIPYQDP